MEDFGYPPKFPVDLEEADSVTEAVAEVEIKDKAKGKKVIYSNNDHFRCLHFI